MDAALLLSFAGGGASWSASTEVAANTNTTDGNNEASAIPTDEAPTDPSNLDHGSDSSADDDSQVSGSNGNNTPTGLFGEAPEEDEVAEDEGVNTEDNANGNQPGSCPTTTSGENRYQSRYRLAWEEIARLQGTEVKKGAALDEITWKVVESVTADEIGPDGFCGAKDEDFYTKSFGTALMMMWPGDFDAQHQYMCRQMTEKINPQRKQELKRIIRPPTKAELYKFIAILIAASQYADRGVNLWRAKKKGRLRKAPDFSTVMSHHRFCEIKAMVPLMMEGENDGNDDWWKVRGFVDGLNRSRRNKLFISKIHVMDECMSGFWPR